MKNIKKEKSATHSRKLITTAFLIYASLFSSVVIYLFSSFEISFLQQMYAYIIALIFKKQHYGNSVFFEQGTLTINNFCLGFFSFSVFLAFLGAALLSNRNYFQGFLKNKKSTKKIVFSAFIFMFSFNAIRLIAISFFLDVSFSLANSIHVIFWLLNAAIIMFFFNKALAYI